DPSQSVDEGPLAGLLEFLSEKIDKYVDHIGECVFRLLPNISAEHGSRDGRVLVPKQVFQNLEFPMGERDLHATTSYAALEEVHFEVTGPQERLPIRAATPQQDPQPGQQFRKGKGLD